MSSDTDTFGFPERNWFSPGTPGKWTMISEGDGGTATIVLYLATILMLGVFATFIDGMQGVTVGVFYMVLLMFALVVWLIESGEDDARVIAIMDLGSSERWLISVPIGLTLGIIFTLGMSIALGAYTPFETLAVFGVPVTLLLKVAAPILMIPIVEEAFFGGVLAPTVAEGIGIVPASILVSMVWVIWHLGTYQSAFAVLGVLFAFRFVATYVTFYTRSLMPALIGHIIVNIFGTLFIA